MAKLNMASINTLFRKGYLLAGVIMAANMFVGNEMKAMNKNKTNKIPLAKENEDNNGIKLGESILIEDNDENASCNQYARVFFNFLLYWENAFNFIGTLFFSGANNYFKWWDYNPGTYWKLVWFGWRSKRFLKDILQFEVNLNAVKGAFWLLLGAYNLIKNFTVEEQKRENYFIPLHVSRLVAHCVFYHYKSWSHTAFIVVFLLQGFVSMPLTLHFSKFSISISLDSIIWGVAGMILELKAKKRREKERETRKNYTDLSDFKYEEDDM